jgi:hypothetical protein
MKKRGNRSLYLNRNPPATIRLSRLLLLNWDIPKIPLRTFEASTEALKSSFERSWGKNGPSIRKATDCHCADRWQATRNIVCVKTELAVDVLDGFDRRANLLSGLGRGRRRLSSGGAIRVQRFFKRRLHIVKKRFDTPGA